MLFRWSIWGEGVHRDGEMLRDSISSFRAVLGSKVDYLVSTDDPKAVKHTVGRLAEVSSYFHHWNPRFTSFDGVTPWAKWCPWPRLAFGEVEVYVDSDVFLLDRPDELLALCSPDSKVQYLAQQEVIPATWQRGFFSGSISPEVPFLNAGFFAQGPAADVSESLEGLYHRWIEGCSPNIRTSHDEQGALTKALESEFYCGRAAVLPTDRYTIISPRSNSHIQSLDGLVLIHTTYPAHPAYHRFRDDIRRRWRTA
jgi:hypothetical protein